MEQNDAGHWRSSVCGFPEDGFDGTHRSPAVRQPRPAPHTRPDSRTAARTTGALQWRPHPRHPSTWLRYTAVSPNAGTRRRPGHSVALGAKSTAPSQRNLLVVLPVPNAESVLAAPAAGDKVPSRPPRCHRAGRSSRNRRGSPARSRSRPPVQALFGRLAVHTTPIGDGHRDGACAAVVQRSRGSSADVDGAGGSAEGHSVTALDSAGATHLRIHAAVDIVVAPRCGGFRCPSGDLLAGASSGRSAGSGP